MELPSEGSCRPEGGPLSQRIWNCYMTTMDWQAWQGKFKKFYPFVPVLTAAQQFLTKFH
jgi:hypothetical protein